MEAKVLNDIIAGVSLKPTKHLMVDKSTPKINDKKYQMKDVSKMSLPDTSEQEQARNAVLSVIDQPDRDELLRSAAADENSYLKLLPDLNDDDDDNEEVMGSDVLTGVIGQDGNSVFNRYTEIEYEHQQLKANFESQEFVERKFDDFNVINIQPEVMIQQTYHTTEPEIVNSAVDQNTENTLNILDHISSHTVTNFEKDEVSDIALETSSHSMFSSKISTKPKHTVSILSNFFNKFQRSTTDQPLITSLNKTSNPNFFSVENNDSSTSWANIKITESNTSREDLRNSTPTTEQISKKNPQFSTSKFFLSNIFATTKGFSPSKILEFKYSKSSNVNLDPCRADFMRSYYENPDDKIVGNKNLNTKNILRHKDAGKNSDSHKSRTLSKDRTSLNSKEFSLKNKASSKTRGNSLYGDVSRKKSKKRGNTNYVKEKSKNRSSSRDETAAATNKTAASKESKKIRDQSSTKKLGQHSKLKPSNIPPHLISNLNSILLKGSNNSLTFTSSKLSVAASTADQKLKTSSLSSENSINADSFVHEYDSYLYSRLVTCSSFISDELGNNNEQ